MTPLAGLVPAIHVFVQPEMQWQEDVDAPDKPGQGDAVGRG
jgi:hypothetical protein